MHIKYEKHESLEETMYVTISLYHGVFGLISSFYFYGAIFIILNADDNFSSKDALRTFLVT